VHAESGTNGWGLAERRPEDEDYSPSQSGYVKRVLKRWKGCTRLRTLARTIRRAKSDKERERIEGETTQCSKYEETRKEEAARNRHGIVYTLRQTAMITSMRY
jgi:hypothetical protein